MTGVARRVSGGTFECIGAMRALRSRVGLQTAELTVALVLFYGSLTAATPIPLSSGAGAGALFPFQPTADKHTGAAVVIVPAVPGDREADDESSQLARWLSARGIAGFVLRSRDAADVSRAVSVLRADANALKISPRRIALLGVGRGGELAAQAGYADASESSARPNLLALIWGGMVPGAVAATAPPTFLVGSTRTADNMGVMIDLWTKLRGARVPVDAHFFASANINAGPATGRPSHLTWPEMFFAWVRFQGLLTDEARLPIKGMVHLDGRVLPHGYVIFTPLDFVGAGPIIGRVFNSNANAPLGQFSVAAHEGPIAGRYKVDVRQNMNRWLSNSFSGGLVSARGGAPTPEQIHFGHHRVLAPSIDDQRSFTKRRPTDKEDLVVEIKPGADANLDLKIEVFSSASPSNVSSNAKQSDNVGGIVSGPKNPGQAAYVEQLKVTPPGSVPAIPEPILLWPKGAPEAVADANGVFTDEDKPAIYAFPAPATNNTGAAFLIIPGGGFTNRVMDTEGVQVAKFLNRHGISGFVLRYRLGPNYSRRAISTKDGHRAMRYIRAHAADLKIAPDRIGTIGFSAGAELQGDAFYNSILESDPNAADPIDRASTRANFNALIYGGRNPQKPGDAAPTFLFNTIEDAGHLNVQVAVMNALRQAGVPVEAHFYQVGPHGSTMSPGDPQLGQWPDLMISWLANCGVIPRPARPAGAE